MIEIFGSAVIFDLNSLRKTLSFQLFGKDLTASTYGSILNIFLTVVTFKKAEVSLFFLLLLCSAYPIRSCGDRIYFRRRGELHQKLNKYRGPSTIQFNTRMRD